MNAKKTDAIRNKISKAMKGNKNAEKWTEKVVIDILNGMIEYCMEEYEVEIDSKKDEGSSDKGTFEKETKRTIKRHVHLKKSLLVYFHLWNPKWFAHMGEKFGGKPTQSYPNPQYSPTVLNLLKAIDMILESNSYNDAASGNTVANVTMMHLSTHYGYTNKQENKNTLDVKGGIDVNMPEPSDDAKEAWEKAKNMKLDED